MSSAYYNEFDPFAAAWLRNLIAANLIAPGDVDERSILEVSAADLRGYTQCHFFAGIGVWSHALRGAGWRDDRPVWTGSCPCQPFSNAGKRGGAADERHLWPAWLELIRECRPGVVFGEQVEAAIRLGWLDAVQADLEGCGYAVGAVGFPAAGVGAPHIRPRLWFVADRVGLADAERGAAERLGQPLGGAPQGGGGEVRPRAQRLRDDARDGVEPGELADAGRDQPGRRGAVRPADGGSAGSQGGDLRSSQAGPGEAGRRPGDDAADGGAVGLGDADDPRLEGRAGADRGSSGRDAEARPVAEAGGARATAGPCNGFWADAEWIPCRDGRSRPTEPGTFPLAHGAASRVGRLRAYGNALVAPAAEAFIDAYLTRDLVDRHITEELP